MNKQGENLLILDLDETLIHATTTQLKIQEDFRYQHYFIYKRPGLKKFLVECSQFYTIAIWSSAEDEYVSSIAEQIIGDLFQPVFIWGRSACWVKITKVVDQDTGLKRKVYKNIKPLEKVCRMGYSMDHLLIVDDSTYKVEDNPGNYLIIPPFEGNPNDCELEKLLEILRKNIES